MYLVPVLDLARYTSTGNTQTLDLLNLDNGQTVFFKSKSLVNYFNRLEPFGLNSIIQQHNLNRKYYPFPKVVTSHHASHHAANQSSYSS